MNSEPLLDRLLVITCALVVLGFACLHRVAPVSPDDAQTILLSIPLPSPTPQVLPEFDTLGNLILAGGVNEVATSGLTVEQALRYLSPGCLSSWSKLPPDSVVVCYPEGYPMRDLWDPP